MATTRFYKVILTPAKIENGGWSFMLFDPASQTYAVTASSMPELTDKVKRLAHDDFKRTCAVNIFLPRGERKPPGFDKARDAIRYIEVPLLETV